MHNWEAFSNGIHPAPQLYPKSDIATSVNVTNMNNTMIVKFCGISSANEVYQKCGIYKVHPMISKTGVRGGKKVEFKIYKSSAKWSMSIVPDNLEPGSDGDIHLYYEDTLHASDLSRKYVWKGKGCGILPTPVVHLGF